MKIRNLALLISTFLVVTFPGVAAVSSASAQTSTTGNIEGTVVDTTGAAIPGVTVIATNQTGRTASSTTNDEGFFRITNLEPGRYTVRVEAEKGFAKFEQANVEVNLSRSTNVGIQLRPVGAAEQVEVTASTPATVERPATTGSNTGKVTTNAGLTTVTFDTKFGNVRVNLPDDMRAGDTISGTVVSEPKGQTPDERAKNGNELKGLTVEIDGKMVEFFTEPLSAPPVKERESLIQQTFWVHHSHENRIKLPATTPPVTSPMATSESGGNPGFSIRLVTGDSAREELGRITIPYTPVFPTTASGAVITPDPKITPRPGTTESGAVITPDPKITPTFIIPPLGQTGRPLVITGPFDGDSRNVEVFWSVMSQDNVRQPSPEDVRTDSTPGNKLDCGAESPRKAVFEAPTNVTGPIELNLKEGNVQTKGTYRNVGVNLSAPKTNLLKGEKTTLTIEVRGLEGIQKPVPLTLTSEGVITMEGGPYQPLMIQPSQVDAGGRYSTTRGVTGIQAGGWGATATVVTGRFNVWLQDDMDPNRLFHFNSFTGDYIFACGGGSCRSGGGGTSSQPPTGSSVPPPPVTLTGIGKPQMKGCIITLSHNAPDRRVFARLDACTKTGDASVETKSPKANFNITDKNTTDNPVASPPK